MDDQALPPVADNFEDATGYLIKEKIAFLRIVEALPLNSPLRDRTGMLCIGEPDDPGNLFNQDKAIWKCVASIARLGAYKLTHHKGHDDVVFYKADLEGILAHLKEPKFQTDEALERLRELRRTQSHRHEAIDGRQHPVEEQMAYHDEEEILNWYFLHLRPDWIDAAVWTQQGFSMSIVQRHVGLYMQELRKVNPNIDGLLHKITPHQASIEIVTCIGATMSIQYGRIPKHNDLVILRDYDCCATWVDKALLAYPEGKPASEQNGKYFQVAPDPFLERLLLRLRRE